MSFGGDEVSEISGHIQGADQSICRSGTYMLSSSNLFSILSPNKESGVYYLTVAQRCDLYCIKSFKSTLSYSTLRSSSSEFQHGTLPWLFHSYFRGKHPTPSLKPSPIPNPNMIPRSVRVLTPPRPTHRLRQEKAKTRGTTMQPLRPRLLPCAAWLSACPEASPHQSSSGTSS